MAMPILKRINGSIQSEAEIDGLRADATAAKDLTEYIALMSDIELPSQEDSVNETDGDIVVTDEESLQ